MKNFDDVSLSEICFDCNECAKVTEKNLKASRFEIVNFLYVIYRRTTPVHNTKTRGLGCMNNETNDFHDKWWVFYRG